MRRKSIVNRTLHVTLVTFVLCAAAVRADSPADRFVAGLDGQTSIPADARELIRTTWANCKDCDGDEFLTQGLAVLSPEFREGLDAYDAESYGECAGVMRELQSDRNPFVATHAAAYEIKALVAMERFADAEHRIEAILYGTGQPADTLIDISTYSYFEPEIGFLRGFCLLADLQYEAARLAFDEFVTTYPDSSQRLVLAGKQMLMELLNRDPGQLGDVVDLMNYSGRWLGHGASGEPVQTRQQEIIDILDALIEEAEKQESQQSSSSSGGGSGGPNQQGGATPSTPMQDSMLPGGKGQEGRLREHRRANPGEMWGAMPPAQRERILQALRDNFPRRYRQLVEQYYEELAKKP